VSEALDEGHNELSSLSAAISARYLPSATTGTGNTHFSDPAHHFAHADKVNNNLSSCRGLDSWTTAMSVKGHSMTVTLTIKYMQNSVVTTY